MSIKKPENLVEFVRPQSPADRTGIKKGDKILSINSYPISDTLDYISAVSGERTLVFEIKREYEILEKWITLERGEEIGITLAPMDLKICRCRCVFCFYDQMPQGMRKSLYIKDDDYRYSFFYGSFITLTNLSESDWQRIIRMRLSPLFVSVHSTNDSVRKKMMGYSHSQPIMESLKRLTTNGISLHTQIVVVPGYNDREVLHKTVKALIALGEKILSIGVVPVGLTRYRKNLTPIRPVSPSNAKRIVTWHYEFIKENPDAYGKLQLADEFFTLANTAIPPSSYYAGFPQYENGIGMIRYFCERAKQWSRRKFPNMRNRRIGLATGGLFAPVLRKYALELENITGAKFYVISIENKFFGRQVNVANLITGRDFVKALSGVKLDAVVIPPKSAPQNHFLDDICIKDIEHYLGYPVVQAPHDPAGIASTFKDLTIMR